MDCVALVVGLFIFAEFLAGFFFAAACQGLSVDEFRAHLLLLENAMFRASISCPFCLFNVWPSLLAPAKNAFSRMRIRTTACSYISLNFRSTGTRLAYIVS